MIDERRVEKAAERFRKKIETQDYGITDIFASIGRDTDIDVIRHPFGKKKLDGFATVFEGTKTVITNSSNILSREIFTLAHEIGHIIFDFEDGLGDIHIDDDIDVNEGTVEKRASYFAACFLMPEEKITGYIKYQLNKDPGDISALDIVRMQSEFNVSYASLTIRLKNLGLIDYQTKAKLFDIRDEKRLYRLFEQIGLKKDLLRAAGISYVPHKYIDYILTNYKKNHIPYSSYEKAMKTIGIDPSLFLDDEEVD